MPQRHFENLGELLTKALISGDFALYAEVMSVPIWIIPREGQAYHLATMADLQRDFDLYHAIIKTHGVTDIYRQILHFDTLAEDRVLFTCMTHIMVRAQRIVEPFETRMTLRRQDDGWRIAEIESSEGHINWTLGRAAISPDQRFDRTDQGGPDAET